LILAFPDADQGWLAWIALAPLVLACRELRPARAAIVGLLVGAVATLCLSRWMFEVSGFGVRHAVLLAVYLGLYPAAWSMALGRLDRGPLPLVVTAPALWVALDYVRAHAGFLAVSWTTLAHSQHRNLSVLQAARAAGEYGVTFLVASGSVALAQRISGGRDARALGAAAAAIVGVHAAGALALGPVPGMPTLRVAVVQPSIRPVDRATPDAYAATLDRLARLTRDAARTGPAVIVWPETAVRQLGADRSLQARLGALAEELGTSLVVGASDVEKFARPEGPELGRRAHNAAYLIQPGRPLTEPYRKMRLVPFGEYVPLEGRVPWPRWVVSESVDGVAGEERRLFALPNGVRLATLICWENLFGIMARRAVMDGAELVVQLTNDSWFGPTAAPRQHNLASVLRAVENRIPVVIASNTGPSAVVDPWGRVLTEIPTLFAEGIAVADVPLGGPPALYTRWGDAFVFISAAVATLGLALGKRRTVPPSRDQRPAHRIDIVTGRE
jgi:apolipoprotein N-acyltransferase